MPDIDIRNHESTPLNIKFADGELVSHEPKNDFFTVRSIDSVTFQAIDVYTKDIDNLIMALQYLRDNT